MITDEFTHLKVSKERKYQLRRQRDGLCIICGKQPYDKLYCQKHAEAIRARNRERYRRLKKSKML